MRPRGLFGAIFAGFVVLLSTCDAVSQTTPTHNKAKTPAKTAMAVWSPEVQQTLGLSATDFKTTGLNKLTQTQLQALENSAKSHPYLDSRNKLLSCTANAFVSGSHVRVVLSVAGDDPTGQRAAEIRKAVQSVSGVELVDVAANAERALHVVIQEQTLGKRTIGYTASYVTGTPCVDETSGKTSDVELKGQLGTYTDPKGVDLARDLAGMLDQDLQSLRGTSSK